MAGRFRKWKVPQPDSIRRLFRPGCNPCRRRLFYDCIKLLQCTGAADFTFKRFSQLESSQLCIGRVTGIPLPQSDSWLRGMGTGNPVSWRNLLYMFSDAGWGHLHDNNKRPVWQMEQAGEYSSGSRLDWSVSVLGWWRKGVSGSRCCKEPYRIQECTAYGRNAAGRYGINRRRSQDFWRQWKWSGNNWRSENVQAQRLVLCICSGRRCKDRLADSTPF